MKLCVQAIDGLMVQRSTTSVLEGLKHHPPQCLCDTHQCSPMSIAPGYAIQATSSTTQLGTQMETNTFTSLRSRRGETWLTVMHSWKDCLVELPQQVEPVREGS